MTKLTIAKAHEATVLRNYFRWNNVRIAKKLGVSEGTIRNFWNDQQRGLTGARPRNRETDEMLERRSVIEAITDEELKVRLKGRQVIVGAVYPSLGDIAAEYERRSGKTVASATVFRDLKALGYVSKIRPRVVNNDPEKNSDRLKFAKGIRKASILGKDIIFSDECWVNDNDNANSREWRRGDAAASARKFQKRASVKVMVWGAIGKGFKSELRFIDGTVTAAHYIHNTLPDVKAIMRRYRSRHFMHDGAKAHTANATRKWLEDSVVRLLRWPAHSPHLNPIEKLWNHLHVCISKKRPQSLEDLKRKAQEVWDSFDQKMIDRYIDAFDKGIARTITDKGLPW